MLVAPAEPCLHACLPACPACLPACHASPYPRAAVCPDPTPTNLVQLLAAGIYLHPTGNPEPAIAMLSAVLSGVWPAPRRMRRQLAVDQFVPSLDSGASSNGATEGAVATHSAASAAGPSSSSPQQAEKEQESAPTQLAADLAAALERHCPGVSLADLHKAALQLRLFFGCSSLAAQAAAGPSLQSTLPGLQPIVRTLLLDCQQLLAADPACMHTFVWAAELLLYALWPVELERQAALFQEGLRRSGEAKCECRGGALLPLPLLLPRSCMQQRKHNTRGCPHGHSRIPCMCLPAGWLAEAELAHDCALWQLKGLASEGNVAARQAVLLEARRLLDVMQEAEGRLSAWLPSGRLAPLSQRRQQLGGVLRQMQAEGLRPRGGCRPACVPALLLRVHLLSTPAAEVADCCTPRPQLN